MTSIERNFNGTVYRVSVKEEERRMRMIEGEEEAILQDPRVTEVVLEETCPKGHRPNSLVETPRVKVVSLEVMVGPIGGPLVGQDRGVLLQRWHQEGGEGGAQVVKNKFDNDDLKR